MRNHKSELIFPYGYSPDGSGQDMRPLKTNYMRMKRILGTAFILMITLHVWEAQGQPLTEIQFEKMDHNFGRIREEAGAANFTFKFTNTGKTP